VQTPVKAIGKKCSITLRPLKSAKETSFKSDDINVNWGAGWPTCNDMSFNFWQNKALHMALIVCLCPFAVL
jgi:hypothetical protein